MYTVDVAKAKKSGIPRKISQSQLVTINICIAEQHRLDISAYWRTPEIIVTLEVTQWSGYLRYARRIEIGTVSCNMKAASLELWLNLASC